MNFKEGIKTINKDYCNFFLADYLKKEWGMTVGFKTLPGYIVLMNKELADWQENMDCTGVTPKGDTCVVTSYGIREIKKGCFQACDVPSLPPTQIIINQGTYSSDQFTVGASGGPVNGTTTFVLPYLINKKIEIALIGVLTKGSDYNFDTDSGTITLLSGRLFNTDETYTIFSY